jgi:hypothetical protein
MQPAVDIAHDFSLPIHSASVLREFIWYAWGVRIPDTKVCAKHSTPWAAFCDAYFAKAPVVVWHGSRGFAGKSFLLATLGLTEAVTLKSDVNILGGSGQQSQRVLEHMQNRWTHPSAPTYLLSRDVRTETQLTNGAKIESLMASQASVRGPHPQRLRLDEVDEMDITILDAAMGQPMERDGVQAQTVMSSTRQYANGTMAEVLRRASEKGWPVHEWCYKETSQPHGWLSERQIIEKFSTITTAMKETEYDLQEPSPESRAIQPAAVDEMFKKELGDFAGNPDEYIEIEPPNPKASYATGADWAKEQDWTIITTYRTDVRPIRVIAWQRMGRLDWPIMIKAYTDRRQRFPGAGLHDETGIGNVVESYVGEPGMVMIGQARADLLSEYIAAIERREIVSPFIRWAFTEHKFASRKDVYTASEGHLPDTISAGALGYRAIQSAGWTRSPGKG